MNLKGRGRQIKLSEKEGLLLAASTNAGIHSSATARIDDVVFVFNRPLGW